MVVGLTGKYCTGKNAAADIFKTRGWYVMDVDKFGHDALTASAGKLAEIFGPDIIDKNGRVDRGRLGAIVFGSSEKLNLLESVIHPEMVSRCEREIKSNPGKNILINAAILHHMGLNRLCDSVLWVKSGILRRYARAVRRDSLSAGQILKRFFSQRKLDVKYWGEDVDIHIIWNSGPYSRLKAEVNSLIDILEKRV